MLIILFSPSKSIYVNIGSVLFLIPDNEKVQKKMSSTDTSQILGVMQVKGDHYARLAVIERKRLNDLEDAIDHIMKESEKYRSKAKQVKIMFSCHFLLLLLLSVYR
jgi:hypothetical protein